MNEAPINHTCTSFVGMAAPVLGVLTSLQENVEFYLRILSLLIGIAIGAVSLVRLLRKNLAQ